MIFSKVYKSLGSFSVQRQKLFRRWFRFNVGLFCLLGFGLALLSPLTVAAQTSPGSSSPVVKTYPLPAAVEPSVSESSKARVVEQSNSPGGATAQATSEPVYEYRLPFNRNPQVGNRVRLEGVYAETSLYFSRPRQWQLVSAKAQIRLQHSPSLLPDRSNLVARVNDTSIGSVRLDRPESEIAQFLFDIPLNLLQDQNFLTLEVEQNTSEDCTNPADPALWSEILPDSELLFQFRSKDIVLDFSQYPYPFFDDLSLDSTQLAYLQPKTFSDQWLTTMARYQASIGRLADYRQLESRLVSSIDEMAWNERLIVIGTPTEQPLLKSLSLPFTLKSDQLLDGEAKPLPPEVGILALTTAPTTGNPILVATGNGQEGVNRAVQFLVQSQSQTIGTGKALLVESVPEIASPDPRDWPRYLPQQNEFQLKDLQTTNGEFFEDKTVRGSNAPPVVVSFRALPDDRFVRGSSAVIHYSHSSQINPRTSSLAVLLDDVIIGSKPLSNRHNNDQTYQVSLPPDLIKPDSQLSVQFVMHPQESAACGIQSDRQLWGTLHGDTSFQLIRDIAVKIPDLKLLQAGYPFTAPQDLSRVAIALPDAPSPMEVETLLALSGRFGKISQARDVLLTVYRTSAIPGEIRGQRHWVGIGLRDRFPFEEAFSAKGLSLKQSFTRQWQDAQIQSIQDNEGMVKAVLSPWNEQYILLALTAQTETGFQQVKDALNLDPLFYALEGDTALISQKVPNPSPYDKEDYTLRFLEEAQTRQIVEASVLRRGSLFLENHWFILPTGIVLIALLLYSISQLYLNRISNPSDS